MKLKAQIIEESDAAIYKMREYSKAAKDETKTQEEIADARLWATYYEGIKVALDWVLESRNDFTHIV